MDTGIVNDTRVLLNYSFTCSANNNWTDEFSPQQCRKQSCAVPGMSHMNMEIQWTGLWDYMGRISITSEAGENVKRLVVNGYNYGEQIDYFCLRGFVHNTSVVRKRLVCGLYDNSSYVSWNGTELNCTSEHSISISSVSPLCQYSYQP